MVSVATSTLVVLTFVGVACPWFLPLLADYGFARAGATSISGFIETPAATAGMAVATAGPIWLMGILEADLQACCTNVRSQIVRSLSFATFLIGYAGFLISNVGSYPDAHYAFVAVFSVGFAWHAVLRYSDLRCALAQIVLVVGVVAFIAMIVLTALDVDSLWFWATECIGFTALLTFTPAELYAYEKKNANGFSTAIQFALVG